MNSMRALMEAIAHLLESAQYVNPSSSKIMRMLAAEKDGIRLLWYPDGTLVAWPAHVNDHKGMNAELGMEGGIRFVVGYGEMVARPVNTEDERVTYADVKVALADPRLRPLAAMVEDGRLRFDMAE